MSLPHYTVESESQLKIITISISPEYNLKSHLTHSHSRLEAPKPKTKYLPATPTLHLPQKAGSGSHCYYYDD